MAGLIGFTLAISPFTSQANAHTATKYIRIEVDIFHFLEPFLYYNKLMWNAVHSELEKLAEENAIEGVEVSGLFKDYTVPSFYFSSSDVRRQKRSLENLIVQRINKESDWTKDGQHKPKFDAYLEGRKITKKQFFRKFFYPTLREDMQAFVDLKKDVTNYLAQENTKTILKEEGLQAAIAHYVGDHQQSLLPHYLTEARKFVIILRLTDHFRNQYTSFVKPETSSKPFPKSYLLDRP